MGYVPHDDMSMVVSRHTTSRPTDGTRLANSLVSQAGQASVFFQTIMSRGMGASLRGSGLLLPSRQKRERGRMPVAQLLIAYHATCIFQDNVHRFAEDCSCFK